VEALIVAVVVTHKPVVVMVSAIMGKLAILVRLIVVIAIAVFV